MSKTTTAASLPTPAATARPAATTRPGRDEDDRVRDHDDRGGATNGATAELRTGAAEATSGAGGTAAAGGSGAMAGAQQEEQQGPNVLPQRQLDEQQGLGGTIDTVA